MTDLVMGLIVGFAVGSFLLSVLLWVAIKRVRAGQADRLAAQDEALVDLRQELATDKETNRHLRHQLHSLTSGTEGSAPPPANATDGYELDIDTALADRDAALAELADSQRTLESVRARLEDREAKLREYREAVKEIRLSLESQDQLRSIIDDTQDIPAQAESN